MSSPIPLLQISDFGLSVKMNMDETHISGGQDGTLTHMAPEVLLEGKQSKAADV
jgi:serine/threonine protein kinase